MTLPRRFLLLPLVACLCLATVACDDDDPIAPPRTADMTWILNDLCSDGRGLQAALFETETGRIYPSSSSVYVTGPGGTIDTTISCRLGAQVCYGAEPDPPSGLFWGVGLDGIEPCDDCCDVCNDNLVEFDLFCNGGAPGTATPGTVKVRGEHERVQ